MTAVFQISGLLVSVMAGFNMYDMHGVFGQFKGQMTFYVAVNIDSVMFGALSSYVYVALKSLKQLELSNSSNFNITVGLVTFHFIFVNIGVFIFDVCQNK